MTILRWQIHLGFVKEVSWGSSTTVPQLFIPVSTAKFLDQPKFYYDEAFRSVQAKDFAAYATTFQGSVDYGTDFYIDTVPYFLGSGMIGNTDSVATVNCSAINVAYTTGTVSAHTFLLGTPASFSLFDYNGYTERNYQGTRLSEVDLKYTPDQRLEMTYKGDSRMSVINASSGNVTAATIGTFSPLLAWQGVLTFNGTQSFRLIDSNLTFKRGLTVLFTQANTQSPTNIYAYPMEVDGKATFDFQDETEYNIFRNNVQTATFDLVFAASGSNAIRITIPQPVFTMYEVNRSKDALTADIDFRGIFNTTMSTNARLIVYTNQTTLF